MFTNDNRPQWTRPGISDERRAAECGAWLTRTVGADRTELFNIAVGLSNDIEILMFVRGVAVALGSAPEPQPVQAAPSPVPAISHQWLN